LSFVLLWTPGPFKWKFCFRDVSATTNTYGPTLSFVTVRPSRRSRTSFGDAVAWRTSPLAMLFGTSCFMFGSLEITSYLRE
jgi:hypothetical protein